MARKSKGVPRDNVRTITIGGLTYELEASLGTGIAYSNEFRGKLDAPYKGALGDDMLEIYSASRPKLRETHVDDDGNEVEEFVDNPDYRGIDVEALLRIAWAMAYAAGSTRAGYADFRDEVVHQPAGIFEEASLFEVVVLELGNGIIFRGPEGLGGDGEPDETQGQGQG